MRTSAIPCSRSVSFSYAGIGRWATLSLALLAAPLLADNGEVPPLVGDPVHGEKLFKRASKGAVRVDGNWINGLSESASLKGLETGKGGFPKVDSTNRLDLYDTLAFIRSRNTDIRHVAGDATHALVSKVKYDKHAVERLADRAKIEVKAKDESQHRVFSLYKLDEAAGDDLVIAKPKDTKLRDKLKKKTKVGYVVHMPLKGMSGGTHEATFVVDKDIRITRVVIRGPDGQVPDDLDQVAARLVGRGARGKYDPLALVGAGKAVRELQTPLSEAFLRGMEFVYMYEVEERDYFAFEDDDDD